MNSINIYTIKPFEGSGFIRLKYKSAYYVSSLPVPFGFQWILSIHIINEPDIGFIEKDLMHRGIME
jgi:hypothetical protein